MDGGAPRLGENGPVNPSPTAETVDRVLLAVDLVPSGRVVSYSDVAELVGTSARRVGRIMAVAGHDVCWWRVVTVSGDLPIGLTARAVERWRQEGIPVKASGRGCRIAGCRADLVGWARAYLSALAAAGEPSRQDHPDQQPQDALRPGGQPPGRRSQCVDPSSSSLLGVSPTSDGDSG